MFGIDIEKGKHVDRVYDLNKGIPFRNGFKTILAMEIIEHLDSPIKFLEECHKALKKDGRLVLTTPNATSIVNFLYGFKEEFIEKVEHSHIQYMDRHCIRKLFVRAGFKIEKIELHAAHYNRNYLMRILQKLIPPFRSQMLVVGTKQ